jgi:hypothetical protein
MANEIRTRANFLSGVVDDNPLSPGATTLNSSSLSSFPVVDSTNHAMIVLDPDGAGGTPEIAKIIAHGAGATSATIMRGQENTTARQHNQNTPWTHSALASDLQLSQDPFFAVNATTGTLGDEFSSSTLDPSWIRVDRAGNSTGVTWAQSGDMLSVMSTATDNANEIHALLKPLGGATYPLSIVTATRQMQQYATNYQMLGLVLADGTTYGSGTQLIDMMYAGTSAGAGLQPSPRSITGFSTAASTYDSTNWNFFGSHVWRRWDWTAANTFAYYISPDGVSWIQIGGTISLSFTPTYVGMHISHWGSTKSSVGTFEFIRIT